jgi:hypothetical protein
MGVIQPVFPVEQGQAETRTGGSARRRVTPSILYFGTPVVLLTTESPDGSFNLAALVRPGALSKNGKLIERPDESEGGDQQVA